MELKDVILLPLGPLADLLRGPNVARAMKLARALRPCHEDVVAACLYAAATAARQPRPGSIREAALAAYHYEPRAFVSAAERALRGALPDTNAGALFRAAYRLGLLLRSRTWEDAFQLARALSPCSDKAVAATLLAATVRCR
jgi:hypothetical protein